ncbi:MAG: hypothetical protein IJ744_08180 [Lachnospiraceae bacterium]|nr:hypothetical protein [Lachnospiraceae bacterium]
MTVTMALVDFIPVILFLIAAVILQRDLYHHMSKGAYALFCAGTIMIIIAGFLKATWKLLYGAGICDFERLNQMFFPVQSIGFMLAGLAVVALLTVKQKEVRTYAAAPIVFTGTMIFVALMSIGCLMLNVGLAVLSARRGKKAGSVIFVIAFVLMLGMGYLSSKDFTQASMNWIAQGVNIVGQACFLVGTLMLREKK